ncbi:hypothetical protein GCM10023212_23420 [Luteolibacter yonseiensis]
MGGDKAPVKAFTTLADISSSQAEFSQAGEILRLGLAIHPDDAALKQKLARISFRKRPMTPPPSGIPDGAYTKHLFEDFFEPFSQGTCSLPFPLKNPYHPLPELLDFADYVAPYDSNMQAGRINVFTSWAGGNHDMNLLASQQAERDGKTHLILQDGFVRPPEEGAGPAQKRSILITTGAAYYDASNPSSIQSALNSDEYRLTDEQKLRATGISQKIVSWRISKLESHPRIDLHSRIASKGRKRILLVDQPVSAPTVNHGFGCGMSFLRMWKSALAHSDFDILVKLHPETINKNSESYLTKLLPASLPPQVAVIDFDVNPYCLLEAVDLVFVCTSHLGFEALMAGKEVHCFGIPFYAGWGLTRDHIPAPARRRNRSLEEIFHLLYIRHSRYSLPGKGCVEIEDYLQHLADTRDRTDASPPTSDHHTEDGDTTHPSPTVQPTSPIRILIVIPSARNGATGRYIQTLGESLLRLGCEVNVLAEGYCKPFDNGLKWRSYPFEGASLSPEVRADVIGFSPHIVYANGVRSRVQRAALEIIHLTGARLVMQSEDDDLQIYEIRQGTAAGKVLPLLDKPVITQDEIIHYLGAIDLKHSLSVFLDPSYDRWIEPVTRALCYRLASLHTAIWHPFAQRLAREYGVPTLVVPPVASKEDFNRTPLSGEERDLVLARHGISSDRVVIFIGGALYNYSNEYAVFLTALNIAATGTSTPLALVVTPGRSALPVAGMARERLHSTIEFASPDLADDGDYMAMLKACDIVCSPGLPDTFNRFRLPSRLVKAMAMGKPILTCRCGFGESLEHGVNAFLMDGDSPTAWAAGIAASTEPETRARVGRNGKNYALANFDSDLVAADLKDAIVTLLATPGRRIGDSIVPSEEQSDFTANVKLLLLPYGRNSRPASMRSALLKVSETTYCLDTVVHLGAGPCGELEDYLRLGARRMVLVEALGEEVAKLRKFEDAAGRIRVRQAVVAEKACEKTAVIYRNVREDSRDQIFLSLDPPRPCLEHLPNFEAAEKITVTTTTISEICDGIDMAGPGNLLVLELNEFEASALAATPHEVLRRFQWIAVRVSNCHTRHGIGNAGSMQTDMLSAGFHHVPTPPDFGQTGELLLFQRGHSDTASSDTRSSINCLANGI